MCVNGSVIPDCWALRPFYLINNVASTLWQMKVSSMKLYFGTLVEHYAENSANAECC